MELDPDMKHISRADFICFSPSHSDGKCAGGAGATGIGAGATGVGAGATEVGAVSTGFIF